jgi:signal transduction histidine kinase
MSELVNDVLDLSKLEAGKTTLRAGQFQVKELFSALRGMFKPLAQNADVEVVFEEPPCPTFRTWRRTRTRSRRS